MAVHFARSLGALAADRPRLTPVVTTVGVLTLLAWGTWALRAEVGVHVRSARATVVVERGRFDVVATVDGRVAHASLELGAPVESGAVLVELETDDLDLRAARAAERVAASEAELACVDAELAARGRARAEAAASADAAIAERAAARGRLALAAQLAAEELERKQRLAASGGISALELSAHRTRVAMAEADLAIDEFQSLRRAADERRLAAEGDALREALASTRERLAGAIAQARIDLDAIELERATRVVRAPAAGHLAGVRSLPAGSWVRAGEVLATVVEAGPLVVVAEFPIAAAAGRVRPGQRADMELDGFPWSRFGRVPLRVVRVATEARDGALRVELAVDGELSPELALEHGLPGTVAVRVDELTPAELLLRAAGGGG